MKALTSFFARKDSEKRERSENAPENRYPVKRTKANNAAPDTVSNAGSTRCSEVEELLSHLHEDEDTSKDELTWRKSLEKHFQSATFANLARFVARERALHTVYPAACDTWTALNQCPLSRIKVVIVGQDPYHGPNQAHGLCFSVLPPERPPPSLKNIYKECVQDEDILFERMPTHGNLSRWASQGVLMLNTVLTVRRGQANSHKKHGWEVTTDEIIRAVLRRPNKGCVFLLWGKPATAKALNLLNKKSSMHTVICTSHPSPLGASKTDSPFLGSRCFSRCNQALVSMGHEPINWSMEGGN